MALKSLLALVLLFGTVDQVKITRTFAADESQTYDLKAVDLKQDVTVTAKVTFKVNGRTESNKTPISVAAPSVALSSKGQTAGEQKLDSKLLFDAHGMPLDADADKGEVIVLMIAIAGFSPDADVEVGKSFDVKWAAGGNSLEGLGTLDKVEEKDGKKLASIKIQGDLKCGDHKAVVDFTSIVETATGQLVSSTGSFKADGSEMDVSIKRL